MNLFVIYIGGKTEGSLIELHDLRFVVAESIKQCYEELRDSWWGTPESLHLDCWGILRSVDEFDITIKNSPSVEPNKIYFANLGGYDPKQFTELHDNVFVVAKNAVEAKAKALHKVKSKHWAVPHRDNLYEVEDVLCMTDLLAKKSYFTHLTLTEDPVPFEFTCKYVPIARKSLVEPSPNEV